MLAQDQHTGPSRRGITRAGRITIIAFGLFVVLVGLAYASIESEYGGQPEFLDGRWETIDGVVWDGDPELADVPLVARVRAEDTMEVVFEADNMDDVEAWWQTQRLPRNYAWPAVVVGIGALLIIGGVALPGKHSPEEPA